MARQGKEDNRNKTKSSMDCGLRALIYTFGRMYDIAIFPQCDPETCTSKMLAFGANFYNSDIQDYLIIDVDNLLSKQKYYLIL